MSRSQSALEYMMTYGWAILIIILVAVVLYSYGIFNPIASSPSVFTTTGFSGVVVTDAVANSSFMQISVSNQVGFPINISSIALMIDNSVYIATCKSGVASALQTLKCNITGRFQPPPKIGAHIIINYSELQGITRGKQSSVGNIYITIIQGRLFPPPPQSAYTLVTIKNKQSIATPAPFQQYIAFNASKYSSYEAANLGNIRFYNGSQELYSWCETNCSSSSHKAVFWVKLPNGIPALGTIVLTAYFLPNVTNYDGAYAGEAPELSASYGQYDNGRNVFDFYDNFKGTSINSSEWVMNTSGGGNLYVNNGVKLSFPSSYYGGLFMKTSYQQPEIFEVNVTNESTSLTWFSQGIGEFNGSGVHSVGIFYVRDNYYSNGPSSVVYFGYLNGTTYGSGGGPVFTRAAVGIAGRAINPEEAAAYSNYNFQFPSFASLIPTKLYGFIGKNFPYYAENISAQWARMRAFPPNGQMPGYNFSTVFIPVLNLYLNGAQYKNTTIYYGTQSNFTATITSGYVGIKVNGVTVVPLNKSIARYITGLSPELYKVIAFTNNTNLTNLSYNETVVSPSLDLFLNGAENTYSTILNGTQSNVSAYITYGYVGLILNGTTVVPLTKGKATYINTLKSGIYPIKAFSNQSIVSNKSELYSIFAGPDYLPIVLSNTQTSDTTSHFQQEIEFAQAQYWQYEVNNLSNVEFIYPNGTIIPSWLQGPNSNSVGTPMYWLNIHGIGANSVLHLDIVFLNKTKNVINNINNGWAPELSSKYAEFDDGANVFLLYDNFNGTSLNTTKWVAYQNDASYSVDNGINMSLLGIKPYIGIISTTNYSPTVIVEGLSYIPRGLSYSYAGTGELNGKLASSTGYFGMPPTFGGAYNNVPFFYYAEGAGALDSFLTTYRPGASTYSAPGTAVYGDAWINNTNQYGYVNLSSIYMYGSSYAISNKIYVDSGIPYSAGAGTPLWLFDQWVRIRVYPPNNVMPSVNQLTVQPQIISLKLNNDSNQNATLAYGTQSNFTATITSGYVGIKVNGATVAPLTKGTADYLTTLSSGLYNVTAFTNYTNVKQAVFFQNVTPPGIINVFINGFENRNVSFLKSTIINVTTNISHGYVGLAINGTVVTTLTKQRAVYVNTLSPGIHDIIAFSNFSANANVKNVTEETSIINRTIYLPISITNRNSKNTSFPFQQQIYFNAKNYWQYELNNMTNLRFIYPNGTIVPSWLEKGNSNVFLNISYWIKLDGISSNKSQNLYLEFANVTTLNNINTGWSPNLTSVYGQFDDGANVFLLYDNFNGTSLNTTKWNGTVDNGGYGSGTISVHDGINLTGPYYAWSAIFTKAGFAPPIISEAYINNIGLYTDGLGQVNGSNVNSIGYGFTNFFWSQGNNEGWMMSGSLRGAGGESNYGQMYPGINGFVWLSPSSEIIYKNYTAQYLSHSFYNVPSLVYPLFGHYSSYIDPGSISLQWARVRAYPPNGIMPALHSFNLQIAAISLKLNNDSNQNATLAYGTQSNFTATITSGYVGIKVNGTIVTPLSKSRAVYTSIENAGTYNVSAFTNTSGVKATNYIQLITPVSLSLLIGNGKNANSTINNGSSQTITAKTTYGYVGIKQNGTIIVPLSKGNATYSSVFYGGMYNITAFSNLSASTGIKNISRFISSLYKTEYLQITIMQTSGTNTASPYLQNVSFNPKNYWQYELNNMSNIRFNYPNGTVIPSWLESGNNNSHSLSNYWLRLSQLQNNVPVTINMTFVNTSKNVLNKINDGFAPNLTSVYGQFDDGANVFLLYDNFNGTSLNASKWISNATGGNSITVNNGLNIEGTASTNLAGIISVRNITPPVITDAYITSISGYNSGVGQSLSSNFTSGVYMCGSWNNNFQAFYNYYFDSSNPYNYGFGSTIAGEYGTVWYSTSNQYCIQNYKTVYSVSATQFTLPSKVYLSAGKVMWGGERGSISLMWIRARSIPVTFYGGYGSLSITFGTVK